MSEFLAHDANFVRQISQQMVHVTQPSVRINNLDSNLIEITIQFSSFIAYSVSPLGVSLVVCDAHRRLLAPWATRLLSQ